MPASNHPQLDMHRFLAIQCRERYRAFVLHAPAQEGKTTFARTLSKLYEGGAYWSVLEHVLAHGDLARQVDLLDVQILQTLVLAQVARTAARLFLVDDIDFLVPIWDDDLAAFKRMVEKLSSPRLPAIVGFVLQTHPAILGWTMTNTYGQSRVLQLDTIAALQPCSDFGQARQRWSEGARP